jgi:hypothetical protein
VNGFGPIMMKGRRMPAQVPLRLFLGAGPLRFLGMLQVCVDER